VLLSSQQVSYGLNWDRTRIFAVRRDNYSATAQTEH